MLFHVFKKYNNASKLVHIQKYESWSVTMAAVQYWRIPDRQTTNQRTPFWHRRPVPYNKCIYTTMHTNEAIWLVLERAWLEYRSRLTSQNIKTWLFPIFYINCIFLPFIDTFYEKYGRKHHGINTGLVRRKFRRSSTKRTVDEYKTFDVSAVCHLIRGLR